MKKIFILAIAMFKIFLFSVYAEAPVIVNDNVRSISLGRLIEIFEDRNRSYSAAEVFSNKYSSIKSAGESPSFGFTRSVYWVKFSVKSESKSSYNTRWLLELDYPLMDKITLYEYTPAGTITTRTTGYAFPYNTRDIRHRNFIFNIEIPPETTKTFLMRFENEDRMEFPLTLWSSGAFQEKDHEQQYVLGIYYGIIFVMFFYNLFIFLSIRDRSYLYYIFYIFMFWMFQSTQNGLAYEYMNGIIFNTHYIPQVGSILMLTSVYFAESFLNMKKNLPGYHRFYPAMKVLLLLSTLAPFVLNYTWSILFYIFTTVLTIILIYSSGIICAFKKYRPAVYYTMAWTFVLFGGLIYAMKVLAIVPNNYFTSYAIQVGSALEVMLLSFGLGNKINMLNEEKDRAQQNLISSQQVMVDNLNRSKTEIEEAHTKLGISEERYRHLVESSSDIIFTLDEDLKFITANYAIERELRLHPENIQGKNFIDILYTGDEVQSMFGMLVQEKIDEFVKVRQPVRFRAQFKSPISTEPKEMLLQMEFINAQGRNEILGKISNIIDDTLLRYFVYEKQKYSISNYLINAEDITHRITRNLKRFIQDSEIRVIQIALREIIINAIEHGNLGVTFQDKSEALENDCYFQMIREKQNSPECRDRRVHVEYIINGDRASFIVSDEGDGFEHQEYLSGSSDTANREFLSHGRGLSIVRNAFDEISFNKKGNLVMLVKYFGGK